MGLQLISFLKERWETLFLILLGITVFFGSKFLAIETPIAQVTIYRLLTLTVLPFLFLKLLRKDRDITLSLQSYSTPLILTGIFWLIEGFLSVIWVIDRSAWIQTFGILLFGVSSLLAFYFFETSFDEWKRITTGIWIAMSVLVLLGIFEVLTGYYFFADVTKLDKYGTFSQGVLNRIPITIFANQNDYATMLLAYSALSLGKFAETTHPFKKVMVSFFLLLTGGVILLTRSRLSILLYLVLFILILFIKVKKRPLTQKMKWSIVALAVLFVLFVFFSPLRSKLLHLIYTGGLMPISGDTRRISLWRNGLLFLAQTFGIGVGAGNLEIWMQTRASLPVEGVYNLHNWWLEILVDYGVLTFVFYVVSYGLLIYALIHMRRQLTGQKKSWADSFLAFLLIYIFASVTSSNNMMIEWHWVIFGLILAFIRLSEKELKKQKKQNKEKI